MADTFSVGLANQGLKTLVNSPVSLVMTIPVEVDSLYTIINNAENSVITTQTTAANRKVTLSSITVKAANVDNIFRLYRGSAIVQTFVPKVALQTIQMFPVGGGVEFDETETWKVTVQSVAGAGGVEVCASGRAEAKRNELFSQVLA